MSWLTKLKFKKLHSELPSANIALLLMACILLAVSLSLLDTLIIWILLLVFCGAVIRAAIYFNLYKHLPSIRTLNLLAALSVLGLVYSGLNSGLLFGMVNLLILACALKLMQMRNDKDVYQLSLSLFFLIGCGFIFNQSIAHSIFYVILVFSLLFSLACYHAPAVLLNKQFKQVLTLSAQALPIGILMFLVLPQLPPLWHTPKSKGAETGLSEQITPGDIAELSQSSELAFRATFNNSPPVAKDRYWRAIVMEDFDGKTWKINPYRQQMREFLLASKQSFIPKTIGYSVEYEIIAEPTHQQWLFGLDIAVPANASSNRALLASNDFTLFSKQSIVSKLQYAVRSYPNALVSQPITTRDQQLNLRVPENGNKQTQKWVDNIRQQYTDDQRFINAVLDYFVQQPFSYTLRPPVMLVDPIDSFLFEQQAGFCSHYASALAYMLRLGGIPARIVTGYQGGELAKQPDGSAYLSVYQYDAHAWVEAWTEKSGWQRMDPTALVSPDRIEFGLQQAMQEEGSFLADSPFSLARLNNVQWLNSLRLLLADLDYNWSRWVLGFNSDKQAELFKAILGKLTPERLSLLGVAIVLVIGLLLTLFFLPHWLHKRLSKTQRLYFKATDHFKHLPMARQKWQGPMEFNQQIAENFPESVSRPFAQITLLYLRLTYQNATNHHLSVKQCHKMMRRQLRLLKKKPIKNS
jgi:transglutaminase-like putative cysteine protease